MADISNGALATRINDMVSRWSQREKQYQDWIAGTATGGPYGDGRYPLTSSSGTTYYIKSPAALAAQVTDPSDSADAAAAAAAASATAATTAQLAAENAAAQTGALRDAAQAARDAANAARDTALSADADAQAAAAIAQASAADSAGDAMATAAALLAAEAERDAAEAAAAAAAASAAEAATFDPDNFTTPAQVDAKIADIVGSAPEALNALNELAAALGNDPNFATTVNNQLALKLNASAFTWANLADKPTAFPVVAHTHDWSEVTGKPASFVPSAHTHAAADVTSGTFADARISQQNVKQHESSLSIDMGQLAGTFTGTLSFGSAVRQMLNLYSTAYGIGVQSGTLYYRSSLHYAWYKNGAHNDATFNAGGGTVMMKLEDGGHLTTLGNMKATLNFISSTNQAVLSTESGTVGTIYLRPRGYDSAVGQVIINNAGGLDAQDVRCFRGDGTGAVFVGDSMHYLYWDGTSYRFGSGCVIDGQASAVSISSSVRQDFFVGGTNPALRLQAAGVMRRENKAGTLTLQPCMFVQSADPGTAAGDGDLWIW